jgi:hypothetical protein
MQDALQLQPSAALPDYSQVASAGTATTAFGAATTAFGAEIPDYLSHTET